MDSSKFKAGTLWFPYLIIFKSKVIGLGRVRYFRVIHCTRRIQGQSDLTKLVEHLGSLTTGAEVQIVNIFQLEVTTILPEDEVYVFSFQEN